MALTILVSVMLITLIFGMPVAWSLGVSSMAALIAQGIDLQMLPQKMFSGMDRFTLLCVPFFALAGNIMARGGITDRLLKFAVICVGWIRGGLALANVVASMLFGGISGSALADATALGTVEIPMMVKSGYDRRFSAAVTAASACIGPIIPPSGIVIVYAMAVRNISIAAMFAAGMLPGIIIGLALMATCYCISVRRNYPKSEIKMSLWEVMTGIKDAILALMTPVIILGGIIGGIFTPTEAAVIAVVYSFIIAFFVYKELKFSDLPKVFFESAMLAAIIMIIIGTANVFGIIVAFERITETLEIWLRPLGYFAFISATIAIFLIVGMFMDQAPAILILGPVLAPIAVSLGIEPHHYGVIVIMNLVIGLLTPPMGQVLFVISPIAKVPFAELVKEVFIFMLVEMGVLLLVSYVPFICLWIPKLFGLL